MLQVVQESMQPYKVISPENRPYEGNIFIMLLKALDFEKKTLEKVELK